jgi:low temperature requirement protein LtrA
MSTVTDPEATDEVPPLELFFDLVFVFAISQLTRHLSSHLNWHGAGETLALLVAVFGVWSYTSWGSTLPGVPHATHHRTILAVMVVGLLMNAGIGDAYGATPFFFVVPFLACRIGPPIYWWIVGDELRDHYRAMVLWFGAAAILWVVGGLAAPDQRLWWWGAAAAIELGGTWLAHPVPGHHFRSADVAFSPGHMLERSRLFLLIALGEVILATGTAVGSLEPSVATITTAVLTLLSAIALWALYFGTSDRLISERATATSDPLRAARLAVNTQVIVFAALIVLAVGNERAITDPTGNTTLPLTLLLFGGPALYLAVQAWYLHAITNQIPRYRLGAVLAMAAGASVATLLAPMASVALSASILVGVVVLLARPTRISRHRLA